MRVATNLLTALAAGTAMLSLTVMPASAACTRLAFSVNDYGKEGPTRDAKELLDKYIAKKMAEKGVTKYTTGKKDVSCELFLNFIVFDEHKCKAEATVCWDGSALPKSEQVSAEGNDGKQTTGSIEKPAAKSAEKVKKKSDDGSVAAAKAEKPTKDTASPAAESSTAKTIEVAPVKADEAPAQ